MAEQSYTTQDRLDDIKIVISELQKQPHTYETLLAELCNNTTCRKIISRKINNYLLLGEILKTSLPGSRWTRCLFYHPKKEYYIVVVSNRIQNEIYYINKYTKLDDTHISSKGCYLLTAQGWQPVSDRQFYSGNVLLFL